MIIRYRISKLSNRKKNKQLRMQSVRISPPTKLYPPLPLPVSGRAGWVQLRGARPTTTSTGWQEPTCNLWVLEFPLG